MMARIVLTLSCLAAAVVRGTGAPLPLSAPADWSWSKPKLAIDCSSATSVDSAWVWPGVLKYPGSFFSFDRSGAARTLKAIRCAYTPPPSGGVSSLPPVPVTLLLTFRGETFKGGLVVSPLMREPSWTAAGALDKLAVEGFRLSNKRVSPLGAPRVEAWAQRSVLRLGFPRPGAAAAEAVLRGARAAREALDALLFFASPRILYVCAGNTGRSPVAEAVARDYLAEEAAKPHALAVYSRAALAEPSSNHMEEHVVHAAYKLLPDAVAESIEHHEPAGIRDKDLVGAYLILTVVSAAACMVRTPVRRKYAPSPSTRAFLPPPHPPPPSGHGKEEGAHCARQGGRGRSAPPRPERIYSHHRGVCRREPPGGGGAVISPRGRRHRR